MVNSRLTLALMYMRRLRKISIKGMVIPVTINTAGDREVGLTKFDVMPGGGGPIGVTADNSSRVLLPASWIMLPLILECRYYSCGQLLPLRKRLGAIKLSVKGEKQRPTNMVYHSWKPVVIR